MKLSFLHLKELLSSYYKIKDLVPSASINFRSFYEGYSQKTAVYFSDFLVANFADLCEVVKHVNVPCSALSLTESSANSNSFKQYLADASTLEQLDTNIAKQVRSLKLIPQETPAYYTPSIIMRDPFQVHSGDHTYRVVTGQFGSQYKSVIFAVNEEDPVYDYLDKNFLVMVIGEADKTGNTSSLRRIISDQYDINTAHIFAMCRLQNSLCDLIPNKVFINSNDADLLRLKMEKKLGSEAKIIYAGVSEHINKDYQKNTTMVVLNKVMSGELDKCTINNITFTKDSARYENTSITAGDLLKILVNRLDFNGEFDIYTICELYGMDVAGRLDPMDVEDTDDAEKEGDLNEAEEDTTSKKVEKANFTINDIPIIAAINTHRQRFVNNVRINKSEVAKVIHRATCYRDPQLYKNFLKSISKMSIRWHDVIANGLPVKMHENISDEEYRDPVPSRLAPALKFYIDKAEKCIKLQVSEDRGVRVNLGRIISRIDTLNKNTTNKGKYMRNGYYRYYRTDNRWAIEQVAEILMDTSKIKRKVTLEDGTTTTRQDYGITKADILKVVSIANEGKVEALKKSRQFLETAMRMTGAEYVTFKNKAAVKVKGSLRTYAVVIQDAKVYDFDSGEYRCIVNDAHYKGVGYDDVAARLLALKNDNALQADIRTLAGVAQPQYENAHGYAPLRDNEDILAPIIAKLENLQ